MGMKTVQDASLTSVADAIRLKAEIEGTLEFPAQFISAIRNIPTGGGSVSVPPKDVNFYDYDGTVVDAYTASEFASLSAMPQNPKHKGLTAQGWNWSLSDAKAYVAKYGRLNIGQMYVTTSGDTEIDIELHDGRLEPVLKIYPIGTVEIDWGDGTAVDTVTGDSQYTAKDTQHVYTSEGSYTITIHVVSGEFYIVGSSSLGSSLLHKTGSVVNEWRVYQSAIKAVRLGASVYIGDNAFDSCYSLTSVTIPNSITSIENGAFFHCYSLVSVTIPNSVTNTEGGLFNSCYALASVTIPNSITSIEASSFYSCYALASVTIPNSITSINANAFFRCYSLTSVTIPNSITSINASSSFSNCYGIKEVILEPTTPPTLSNSNAFSNNASDRIFIVPKGSLEAYQTASNWSTYASQMREAA